MKPTVATFDEHDHAGTEGWATYQQRPMFRWRPMCALGHHVLPPTPAVRNGYSPSNVGRCSRCRAFLKWYMVGQHRFGSIDRPVA